ncbi:MAG: sulfotransferase family 2 domain-containing protein [Alteromonadaceae bacterium]|nr:sulfotransferase family 2 domain-containing protein [Alteromonadaceae bacterium]
MKKIVAATYYWVRDLLVLCLHKGTTRRPVGYERIYQIHIRKTSGTSVNAAFWAHADQNIKDIVSKNVVYGNQLVMVRHSKQLIEKGHYFYANSHIPYWDLTLPPATYCFCILRDPFGRLVSLYKYYKWILELDPSTATQQEPYYSTLINSAQCASKDFGKFLDSLTRSNIQNQLYNFSNRYDVDEALEKSNELNSIFFQDRFDDAINELQKVAGLVLKSRADRKSAPKANIEISDDEKQRAMELLVDEYKFYNALRERHSN